MRNLNGAVEQQRVVSDMDKQLQESINKTKGQPFQWGKNDCCTMSNERLKQVGLDLMTGVIPEYSTDDEANEIIANLDESITEILNSNLKQIDFNYAKDGDLVMIESELGDTLTIKVHGGLWCMTGKGARLVTRFTVINCWEVK